VKIIVIDPGGTTGIVIINFDGYVQGFIRKHFRAIHIGNNSAHHKRLWTFLVHEHPDVIVCERFDNSGDAAAKMLSLEYIGIVKLYAELFEVKTVWQGADMAKNWAPNDKLAMTTLTVIPLSKWKHANDAMRHALYWICFYAPKEFSTMRLLLLEMMRSDT